MDLMLIDKNRKLQGAVGFIAIDVSEGLEANRFTVTVPWDVAPIAKGSCLDLLGTEYGGVVLDVSSTHEGLQHRRVYEGNTWGGILNRHVARPPSGQDHYQFQGEANDELQRLIDALGIGDLFVAEDTNSGITVNATMRYVPAFDAVRDALFDVGARLKKRYDYGLRKVVLSAVPLEQRPPLSEEEHQITVKHYTPVNHLVCLGEGEMQERIVVDLYADATGAISKTPTFTGIDEIAEIYSYSSADAETLEADGRKTLAEYQVFNGIEAEFPEDIGDVYALDESLRALDALDGSIVTVRIAKKIVTVDDLGHVNVQYEPQPVTQRR